MRPFSVFAPAKVNLALHVLGRRADGYHELDSIVTFADVGDRLTFTPGEASSVTADGPFAAQLPEAGGNIVEKARRAVAEIAASRGLALPPAGVHITKNLPVASGIGGGSSDAAAAIRGFMRLAGLAGIDDEIRAAALKIGADVPVCLFGRACRMRGVGERIEAIDDWTPRHAILVNPGIAVSTPAVFGALGLARGEAYREAIADPGDPHAWRNDLADPAISVAPEIGEVITALQGLPGVTRAFMSGSGATCVALAGGEIRATELDPRWWQARTILS